MNFTILCRPVRRKGAGRLAFAAALVVVSIAWSAETPTPEDTLRRAIERYSPASASMVKQEAADAFFLFEESALDRELAVRDPSLYREVESQWMRLLSDMEEGRPTEAIRTQGTRVLELLARGAQAAEAGSSLFADSMLIILREGFEAILIVSALAAYLVRIGQRSRAPYLYAGAALAVAGSVALWMTTRSLLDMSGSAREAFEGWTILAATGVLFWVSYWLVSKAEADRWQAFIRSRVEQAVGRGALFGLGLLSFIVVFREGLETVLFYEAVVARARSASDQSLLVSGFLTGCAALAALFVAFQRIGPRIPMRAFFNVTGGLLYFMAFRFAGAGIRELQEAGVVRQTPCDWVPDSMFLAQWLGVFPYVEPLALQALLLALAVLAFVTMACRRVTGEAGAQPIDQHRAAADRR
ncbi:MAG: FTR1 family protein [Candidatus Binatia bacterium]